MLNLTYNYKIKPTKQQIEVIEHNLSVCKSVGNYALAERKLWYNSRSCPINSCSIISEYIVPPFEYPTYHTQSANLTQAKKTNPFLKSGNAQAMQQTLRKLDRAFNEMKFQGKGFPRFKKKMKSFNLVSNKIEVEGNQIKMPLLKQVRFIKSREIPEGFQIKQVQVIKKASGYYVNLALELDVDVPTPPPHGHAVGLDVGIKSMLATSDGLTIERPQFLDSVLRKIQSLQRKLRNKKKGSGKYLKLQKRIAKLHEKVANKRKDYHFKLAHRLCAGAGMIFVEDINFTAWSKGMFSKQSLDMGLGQFITTLEYICSQTDTYFAKVNKNYTSQLCPNCGVHTGKKDSRPSPNRIRAGKRGCIPHLSQRLHVCPECGYQQDRDVAAAEVVLKRGLTAVGAPVVKQPSHGGLSGATTVA